MTIGKGPDGAKYFLRKREILEDRVKTRPVEIRKKGISDEKYLRWRYGSDYLIKIRIAEHRYGRGPR